MSNSHSHAGAAAGPVSGSPTITRSSLKSPTKGWREAIAAANLPPPVASLVERVVRESRLWRRERRDVARELVAHFIDALAAGSTPEQAANAFGDPRPAASLIRAAKRRQRPLWWHAWRRSAQAVGVGFIVCIGVYAYLAARLWLLSPSVSRNYVAEFAALSAAVPESDRAWPLYLAALRKLEPMPESIFKSERQEWPSAPGLASWPASSAWLDRQTEALDLLRRAAAKPALGLAPSTEFDEEHLAAERAYRRTTETAAAAAANPTLSAAAGEPPALVQVLYPHLGNMREFARILKMDAALAIERRDPARLTSDIHALLGLSRHGGEPPSLISRLVEAAIFHLTLDVIKDALASGLLGEAELRDLAHRIARFDDAAISIASAVKSERMLFDDVVQRVYSDDGCGDGVPTAEGLRFLATIHQGPQAPIGSDTTDPVERVTWPVVAAGMASRRDITAAADRFYTMLGADALVPFYVNGGFHTAAKVQEFFDKPGQGKSGRYPVLTVLFPAASRTLSVMEQSRQRRDGTMVALALELHRRRTGAYPQSLEELTPRYLPEIPKDRFDGQFLRYRLVTGSPIVYSIGADLIDDGGRAPAEAGAVPVQAFHMVGPQIEALAPLSECKGIGDWILYDPAPSLPTPR